MTPAERHAGVVDEDVDAAGVGKHLGDRCVDRGVVGDVELDDGDALRGQRGRHVLVAAGGIAERGEDAVAGLGESLGGVAAEAARRAR